MKTLDTNYHNVDFNSYMDLSSNDKVIFDIRDKLKNLSSLNIVRNKILLDQTIDQASKFSINKDNIIILGTGGSNLGAKALINILQGQQDKKFYFFDNIDPNNFKNSINKINLDKTGFIVISKSGSTLETLSQFASIIELFDQKNNLINLYSNSLIITQDKSSPLLNIARTNNCTILKHEEDIGGRYSIFSNVGMIPAILAGLNVKQIHAGAFEAINEIENNDFLKIAKFFYYQKNNPILTNSVLLTYSDDLYYFGKWYLQLWAESLGKNKKGITAIHAVGTTDQHSQLQLYLDGPGDKFFSFYTTNHRKKGLKLHNQTLIDNGLNYLVNKSMGDLMQAEQQATIDTFKKKDFALREINIPIINEFSIGKLMAYSIMETIATCVYFKVNPFNQPAVEEGKILTKKYLS